MSDSLRLGIEGARPYRAMPQLCSTRHPSFHNDGGPAIRHTPTFLQWRFSARLIEGDSYIAIADLISAACKAKL